MDMETESERPDEADATHNNVSGPGSKERGSGKVDPSFKSKRYRDKLRTEIKALETLIPIDRSALHRKLDSQTIFRLVISYFRLKVLFKAIGLSDDEDNGTDALKEDEERHIAEKYFEGRNISQILDGFLLVVSTDGTILYASDNVLQYLGFNQVDLLHRCIYGVVHPDDHFDLKIVFEQPPLPGDSGCRQQRGDNQETARPASFICRMKCFNGTTAGYLKIHCVGKVDNFPELSSKSAGSFPQVIRLYCQPFMLTGNDINDDTKQNVFWSKHEMDLKINELDKKAAAMTGYDVDELDGRSIYDFVHPEDVAAFASCHKSLVESTEVQTMYFRLITKNNGLIWLHSRGKVISKNSKKFSIVFTHCPVREEDSTFLQQESTIRQRFAMHDLLQLVQYGYCSSNKQTNTDRNDSMVNQKTNGQICTPHIGFTEDASMSFYSALVSCPSSLHAMSDRHSPVLPSTHVAHKITQREKQLQFQEFRRRQEFEQERIVADQQPTVDFLPYHWQMQQSATFPQQQPQSEGSRCQQQYCSRPRHELNVCETKTIKSEPGYDAPYQPCSYNPYLVFQDPRTNHVNCRPCVSYEPSVCHLPPSDQMLFHLPPSPPVSPRRFPTDGYAMYSSHQPTYYPSGLYPSSQRVVYSIDPNRYNFPQTYHNVTGATNNQPISTIMTGSGAGKHFEPTPNVNSITARNHTKPHANIRLSMHCDYSTPKLQRSLGSADAKFNPYSSLHHLHSVQSKRQRIQQQGACGHNNPIEEERIQYDIEASIHMKIVDNSMQASVDNKQEVDLPSIGSFLDYLNDS